MRSILTLAVLTLLGACTPDLAPPEGGAPNAGHPITREDAGAPDAASLEGDGATPPGPDASFPSACGQAPPRTGQWLETLVSDGVERRFYVSVPADYDSAHPYPVVFGLHGRDYDGMRMRDYLALEAEAPVGGMVFVYPDALTRDWDGLRAAGWQNGPVASVTSVYGGEDDLRFIDAVVAWTRAHLCTDPARYFATGQSWGGDFSNVLGCFRGTTFRATASVAANGDYYLPTRDDAVAACVGQPAAWALHGIDDPYFGLDLGERVRDFWVRRNGCDAGATVPLVFDGAMPDDTCVEYVGCAATVRWCAYNAASGHQVPRAFYAREVMAFFRGF